MKSFNENGWTESQDWPSDGGSFSIDQVPRSARLRNSPCHTGQTTRFQLIDVYAPTLPELFKQITPDLELEGRIILLSNGETGQKAFALVEVPGVMVPLIVPASALEIVYDESTAAPVGCD